MQNAGGRVNGKTESDTEIDEYCNDSIHADEVDEPEPVALKNNDDEGEVEIRRLTALVVHLRD